MENDTDEHVLLDMENRTTEQRFRSEVAALEGWVLEAYDVSETQAHELAARIHCALDSGLGEMNSEQRELYRIDESTEDFVVGIR